MRASRPGRKTSFIFDIHGFRVVPTCKVDRGDDCQIGGSSVSLHVRNVEAGFAHGEWGDGENAGQGRGGGGRPDGGGGFPGSTPARTDGLAGFLAAADVVPHGLLIGLLGDEDDQGQELDWTAKQLIERARESNRKFIWHWMGHHDGDPSDWLAESVETLVKSRRAIHEAIIMRNPAMVWQAA